MSKSLNFKLPVLLIASVLLLFQNCSPFKSLESASHRSGITSRQVFMKTQTVDEDAVGQILALGGGNNGGNAGGTVLQIEDCLAAGECDANGEILVMRGPRRFEQPVRYYCSNRWTGLLGSNVTTSTELKVAFVRANNTVACEVSSPSLRSGVLNQKKLIAEIPPNACPNLVSGQYTMIVVPSTVAINTDPNVLMSRRSLLIGNDNHGSAKPYVVKVDIDARGYITLSSVSGETPFVLFKANEGRAENEMCEAVHSPLVVQLTPQPRKIKLTSPLAGVRFNIIGQNDIPVNSLRRISWFNSGDAVSHYFITLPDSSGRVTGIDQLFGDNTKGPDGRFAENGYEALRKWDRNGDGLITMSDPVFQRLRFWSDRNGNGIAETVELYRMDELALTSIDLNYDAQFAETDRWGNEIRMKSVVENRQGDLFLMYDIWFRQTD